MNKKSFLSHPSWYLWPLPAVAAFLAQRLLAGQTEIVEQLHARRLFRWLSVPIASLTSLLPFSLTEMLLIIGSPLLLAGLIIWLVRLCRRPGRLARAGRLLRRLAWTASILYLAFMLLHGLNYARQPAAESFDLPVRERSAAELEAVASWLIVQSNQLRAGCLEDENGVFRLRLGVGDTLRSSAQAYSATAVEYPLLAGPAIRPKGVLLSHQWSYTGICGLYFPFLVESNVNIDIPEYLIPEIALHEIAHTRGFAREDEAGFIAFLAGIADERPDFAYSVLVDATTRCLNALYGLDEKIWNRVAGSLSKAAWRDIAANNAYWQQFAGPVQDTSNNINNAYLQANLQDDGVQSYGRMIDLVLSWHESRLAKGDLGQTVAALATPQD
jgi:hypothetical protein